MSNSRNPYTSQIDDMCTHFISLAESQHSSADEWSLVYDQKDPTLQVYRLESAENCFKVIAELGSSAESAFDILSDITRRTEWDDLCEAGHVIERIDGSTKVQYMKTKAMWPTASRDVVILGYVGTLPDGRYMNVTRSIEHSKYPANNDGTVRMMAKIAGQIIGPAASGNPNHCSIIQVADGDLKGWIPTSLISYIATKAVPMSFVKLNKIVSQLTPTHESKSIQLSRQPDAYNALTPEKLITKKEEVTSALTPDFPIAPESAEVPKVVTKTSKKTQVLKKISMFGKLCALMEIMSPWMVTFIFFKSVIDLLRRGKE